MKTKKVKITYTFAIKYENDEHLKKITDDLKKEPVLDMGGAGVASDGIVYGYSCKRTGNGVVAK